MIPGGKIADSASALAGWPSAPSGGTGGFGMSAATLYQWVGRSDSASRIFVCISKPSARLVEHCSAVRRAILSYPDLNDQLCAKRGVVAFERRARPWYYRVLSVAGRREVCRLPDKCDDTALFVAGGTCLHGLEARGFPGGVEAPTSRPEMNTRPKVFYLN